MLGKLVLFLLQIVIGWFLAPKIMSLIGIQLGIFELFVLAVVCAIVVFLVGVLAAQVLRDVGQPGGATLSFSLIIALIFAAVALWGPQIVPAISKVPDEALVLAGAIIGYWARRTG